MGPKNQGIGFKQRVERGKKMVTYHESTLLTAATRFRLGDYVQGENLDNIWTVGKVQYKTDDDVVVLDRFNREHTLVRDEAYKASKMLFEKWNEGMGVSELNRFEPAIMRELTNTIPAVDFGIISNHSEIIEATQENISKSAEGTSTNSETVEVQENTVEAQEDISESTENISARIEYIEAKENTKEAQEDTRENRGETERSTSRTRIRPDLSRYVVHREFKTASGRKKVDNNDMVSTLLRGCDNLNEIFDKVAETLLYLDPEKALTAEQIKIKYAHLNAGQQRMCAGNLIRGAMKKIGIDSLD